MKTDMRPLLFLFLFVLLIGSAGCRNGAEQSANHPDGSYYTCPMHPGVKADRPGSCPVCNMALIRVEPQSKDHTKHQGNFITLEKRQQLLAGIKTDTVKLQTILPASSILGTIAIDEELVTVVSSRVKGRVDRLHIKTSGEYLKKGAPVYTVYSEQLLADQKEFLALSDKKKSSPAASKLLDGILAASRKKLLLWGLTEKQVAELEKNNTESPQITFYSQQGGYVTDVFINEGAYVEEGTPILQLTALHQVWVEAQVYPDEIATISKSPSFHVYTDASRDKVYLGRPVFSNPRVENGRKVQLLRLRVDNKHYKLLPGMMVYVRPGHSTRPVLAIPKSSVLWEEMKTVWVLSDDDTFEQRIVKTGLENKAWVEVLAGVKEGEIVVSEGAYSINSEFILQNGAEQRHAH